jgi:hypothetical protein
MWLYRNSFYCTLPRTPPPTVYTRVPHGSHSKQRIVSLNVNVMEMPHVFVEVRAEVLNIIYMKKSINKVTLTLNEMYVCIYCQHRQGLSTITIQTRPPIREDTPRQTKPQLS